MPKKRQYLLFAILIITIISLSTYLLNHTRQQIFIQPDCKSIACPYARKLIDKINPSIFNFNQPSYTFYVANFSKNDKIPIPSAENSILWLGSMPNFNYQRLKKFNKIFTSTEEIQNSLNTAGIKSHFLPIFDIEPPLKNNNNKKFIALINTPPLAETTLTSLNTPYRTYTTDNIKEIIKDIPYLKAAIVADTQLSKDSLDINPIFLTLAKQQIPLATYWNYPHSEEVLSLFDDRVTFYVTSGELSNFIKEVLQNSPNIKKRTKKAAMLVNDYFSITSNINRLKHVLLTSNEKNKKIPKNSINLNIPVTIGHTTSGDYGIAQDLSYYLDELGYTTDLTFWNSHYNYPAEINIEIRGWTVSKSLNPTAKYNILYLLYPQFKNKSNSTTLDSAYYQNIVPLLKPYDAIVTASESLFNNLKNYGINIFYLPQFTNPKRFYPQYEESLKSEILFVGTFTEYRKAPQFLYFNGIPITIYGPNWNGLAKDNYIDNKDLYKYYSSAKIVLNDTRPEMLLHGIISNRIFDATACGTLVISDYMPEIEKIYGDAVPMYKTEQELLDLVKYYLDPTHEKERQAKAAKARNITLKYFTAEKIAEKINNILKKILQNNKNID